MPGSCSFNSTELPLTVRLPSKHEP
uniref:Uncharacterized protein n=1 Tax=Anguilla anguilla TaxID=7936 RepID=A0A0E9UYB5_ANGAN